MTLLFPLLIYSQSKAEEHFAEGNALLQRGFYQKAVDAYTHAIQQNPRYVEAYINRGYAYDFLIDYKQAAADYTQAIALDLNIALVYLNRGLAYANLDQKEKASADYDRAIQLNPQFAEAYCNRAILRQHQD